MPRQVVEDVKKLPKWAQSKIQVLEMRLSEVKSILAEIGSKEPTDTRILRPCIEEINKNMNLPNHSMIEFKPKEGKALEVTLRHDDPREL